MVIENEQTRPQELARLEHGHWAPGVSGNPLGRPPKGLSFTEKLRRKFNQDADIYIAAILNEVAQGNVRAFVAVSDRTEGVPKQTLQIEDGESGYSQLLSALTSMAMGANSSLTSLPDTENSLTDALEGSYELISESTQAYETPDAGVDITTD